MRSSLAPSSGWPSSFRAVALTLLGAVCVIDPLREFFSQDDGWAYARSVERLLVGGDYRLDAWSAANMPVQVYLAAAWAKLFGYSFGVLRLSTLALLFGGLWSLYALLRDHDLPRPAATALTLVFLADPLVLMLGTTFMSDVQFVGWLLLSVWLYARGLGRRSIVTIVLGSLAAACAIGTRQFGIALLGGLAASWVLPRRDARPPLAWLLWAGAAPLTVAAWQLSTGLAEPNFTQVARLHEQRHFLTQAPLALAGELAWRVAVMFQYLGVQVIALLPLLAVVARSPASSAEGGPGARDLRRGAIAAVLISGAVVAVLLLLGSPITARRNAGHVLPLPWMLDNSFWDHPWVLRGLAGLGLATMTLAVFLIAGRWSTGRRLRDWPAHRLLPLSTGLILGLLHIGYVQLNDTYLMGLIPFLLLLCTAAVDPRYWPTVGVRAAAVAALGMIGVLSFWMRGDYNRQEAQWRAADQLVASGLDVRCVGGTRHWAEYHGAFDDWLAHGHPGYDTERRAVSPAGPPPLHEPFYEWLNQRYWTSTAQVVPTWDFTGQPGWRQIGWVPYRDMYFRARTVPMVRREDQRPTWAEPCESPPDRALTDLPKPAR